MKIKILNLNDLSEILRLTKYLNPDLDESILKQRIQDSFKYPNYKCFGYFENETLIGLAGVWETVRLYSGKQAELDHVIIDPNIQSKGIGHQFIAEIEHWASKNQFCSVELNAYTSNRRSHKFYHKEGYEVYGFHFIKKLTN